MRVLGINADADNCMCCGKQGLSKVVWIEQENGDVIHVGTSCATKKHLFMTVGKINEAIRNENYQAEQEHYESEEYSMYMNILKVVHAKKDLTIQDKLNEIKPYSRANDEKRKDIFKRRNLK